MNITIVLCAGFRRSWAPWISRRFDRDNASLWLKDWQKQTATSIEEAYQ